MLLEFLRNFNLLRNSFFAGFSPKTQDFNDVKCGSMKKDNKAMYAPGKIEGREVWTALH